MNGSEFNIDAIMGEVEGVLHKKQLPSPALSEGEVHSSEFHAIDAAITFERNIQRPCVLDYFINKTDLLKLKENKYRTTSFRSDIFAYLKRRSRFLRDNGKSGEADVIDKVDVLVVRDIAHSQVKEEIKKLGQKIPGTAEYKVIDYRVKLFDKWEKLCDELVDLEKSEGTS